MEEQKKEYTHWEFDGEDDAIVGFNREEEVDRIDLDDVAEDIIEEEGYVHVEGYTPPADDSETSVEKPQ